MTSIYQAAVTALAAHWKAHDNKYPQKIVLSPAQHEQLLELRRLGAEAVGHFEPAPTDNFMGAPLEVDDGTPGVLIALDGTQVALAV